MTQIVVSGRLAIFSLRRLVSLSGLETSRGMPVVWSMLLRRWAASLLRTICLPSGNRTWSPSVPRVCPGRDSARTKRRVAAH